MPNLSALSHAGFRSSFGHVRKVFPKVINRELVGGALNT